jgi:signal transduction histidine kinase
LSVRHHEKSMMISSDASPTTAELASLALFRSVDVEELAALLRDCEVLEVPKGEVLIEADQSNDRLYLVLSGELGVHLESPASLPIVTLGRGETVGELSLIDKRPTSAFVVAHEPSRVLVLSEATMWKLVTASHGISLNLLRTLSTRLRTDNALIHEHREQLRQTQKLEALGQLTGGIAHDFNNLLALASMNLELIAELAHGDARIRELAEEARNVLQGGAELTHGMLAFARRQRLETRTVDVNELLAATVELLRRSLGQGIRLRARLTSQRCAAHVDPTQLQSALVNLALNARDAMPDGGTLTLATTTEHTTEAAQPPGLAAGTFVVVVVEDTGHGMAPEVLERAFEPMFTTKGAGAGTGLGLSMVYGFAKQSGGHVTLRSKVGRGTSVTLYLPAAEPASAVTVSGDPANGTTAPGRVGQTCVSRRALSGP